MEVFRQTDVTSNLERNMGKYLQDVELRNHHSVNKKGLLEEAKILSKDCQTIESFFNRRLPKKYKLVIIFGVSLFG